MLWWQIILVCLFGILSCLLVACGLVFIANDTYRYGMDAGEIKSRLKGLESQLQNISKRIK